MKAILRPANAKARALLLKLQALAERGVDGEKIAAQHKLARLKASLDFTAADPSAAPDLFSGTFTRVRKARQIWTFGNHDLDVANSVKWALETTTHIPFSYRSRELLAEVTPASARRLGEIAAHIAGSFRALLDKFSGIEGVNASDRGVFVMGLYDGMMNELRQVGERLPSRSVAKTKGRAKKRTAPPAPSLNIHPYSIGLSLGKQIRFLVPLEQITAELEAVTQKLLHQKT